MLQKVPDALRLAQLARSRRTWEIRKRLGFPDAKRHLKIIALAEERVLAGQPEPVKPPREISKPRLSTRRELSATKRPTRGVELGAGSDKERAPTEADAPACLPCLVVEDVLIWIVDDVATPKRLHRCRHLPRRVDDVAPAKWLHRCRLRPCQTWREHDGDC